MLVFHLLAITILLVFRIVDSFLFLSSSVVRLSLFEDFGLLFLGGGGGHDGVGILTKLVVRDKLW